MSKNEQIKHKGKVRWTTEEYKEIVWCHFHILGKTGTANLKQSSELWQTRNPQPKHNLTANTMATQRRYILNNNKLTEAEIDEIKTEVTEIIKQATRMTNEEDRNKRRMETQTISQPRN
ncbi:unnamed protein product [Ceutorhynchus assimilis]|uniref:Uncharacterized protein n=1 Tax=Ceutorhynchus assimilis TaxID=467358 RepID=A0A9N9MYV9_9CUCU|nr:unnamed protein product [Ceutorhynchus assimilis]